jgi:hypothetical protein
MILPGSPGTGSTGGIAILPVLSGIGSGAGAAAAVVVVWIEGAFDIGDFGRLALIKALFLQAKRLF